MQLFLQTNRKIFSYKVFKKMQYDIYNPKCPSHNVLEVISDKWSILTIHFLSKQIYRFGALKRDLPKISAKMLTQTLKRLEEYGFIQRKVQQVSPLKVEYSLSQIGTELSQILHTLTVWSENNMEVILQCKEKFKNN